MGCEGEAGNTASIINSFQVDPVNLNPGNQATLVVSADDAEGLLRRVFPVFAVEM